MDSNLFRPTRRPLMGPTTVCECVCSEEGGGCELFLRSLRCTPVSASVWAGQAAPSEAAHLIDQPHVCLTVPLGAIWHSSLIFPLSLPIHLIFLPCQYPLRPTLRSLSLRPPPPNLAFCASASLLFHSLPINLVCLGWRGGGEVGGKDTGREGGLLKGSEVQLGGLGGGREWTRDNSSVKRHLNMERCWYLGLPLWLCDSKSQSLCHPLFFSIFLNIKGQETLQLNAKLRITCCVFVNAIFIFDWLDKIDSRQLMKWSRIKYIW